MEYGKLWGFIFCPSRKIDSSDGFQFFTFILAFVVLGGRCKDPPLQGAQGMHTGEKSKPSSTEVEGLYQERHGEKAFLGFLSHQEGSSGFFFMLSPFEGLHVSLEG